MKILHIDSSPMLRHSSSRKLSQALDHQESYLQATLKLMGITNTHILRAEGVDKTQPGRELAEQNALAQIPDLITQVFNHYL